METQEAVEERDVVPDAVWAISWGILGLFFCGLVVGWIAINTARGGFRYLEEHPNAKGAGLLKAGFILGIFDVFLWTGLAAYALARYAL